MQWIKQHKRVPAAVLAAVLVWWAVRLLAAWVRYDVDRHTAQQPRYQIVNDEYSQIIDVPEDGGLYQSLPIEAGQTFYGVRLNFSTHGQAYHCGMVMVDVTNGDGELILQSAANFETIRDDTFAPFYVSTHGYTPEHDEVLTVHIYNAVEWEGPLGLWASEGEVDGMPLCTGDEDTPADATLAIQIVSDYTGEWVGALLTRWQDAVCWAAALAVLLCVLRAPAALTVAAAGLLLGFCFTYITPPLTAPDEYTHLAAAYELASVWNGQTAANEDGKLLVRVCDAAHFGTKTGEIGAFAYKAVAEGLENDPGGNDAALSAVSEADAGQGRAGSSYLAQSFGIWLARRQGAGFYTMLRWGRMANLVLYLALAAAAALAAPRGLQWLFACAALLPMPLQLAASLSPDAAVIGCALCFTALCLRLRGRKAGVPSLLALAALALALAPAKAVYLPLVLLCLIVPSAHLDVRRAPAAPTVTVGRWQAAPGTLFKAALLCACGALWCAANLDQAVYAARDMSFGLLAAGGAALAVLAAAVGVCRLRVRGDAKKERRFRIGLAAAAVIAVPLGMLALSKMPGGLTPEQLVEGIQPNGDSIYTFSFGYICRNLPATAKMLARTLPEQGGLWLQGLLGTTLGEPIVYRVDVSWLLGVGLLLALLAAALPVQGTAPVLGRRSRRGAGLLVLCVAAITFVTALSWTPINYETLFGLQGRYWLPVLPLALVWCRTGRTVQVQRDLSRPALCAAVLLTVLVQLQGFGLYATWTL